MIKLHAEMQSVDNQPFNSVRLDRYDGSRWAGYHFLSYGEAIALRDALTVEIRKIELSRPQSMNTESG